MLWMRVTVLPLYIVMSPGRTINFSKYVLMWMLIERCAEPLVNFWLKLIVWQGISTLKLRCYIFKYIGNCLVFVNIDYNYQDICPIFLFPYLVHILSSVIVTANIDLKHYLCINILLSVIFVVLSKPSHISCMQPVIYISIYVVGRLPTV